MDNEESQIEWKMRTAKPTTNMKDSYTVTTKTGGQISMTREEAIYAWVWNAFETLKECGVIEGGKYAVTNFGKKVVDELEGQGFQPTEDEICEVAAAIWMESATDDASVS